jgi:2'-5' RNA ligase
MHLIISELDPESANTVSNLWYDLRKACGLKAIYDVPRPHVTWFGADYIDVAKITPIMNQIANGEIPFTLRSFGIGVFSGKTPVLYLPIVKTEPLFSFHKKIWNQVHPYSTEASLYYAPDMWVPHITLALKDLNQNNLTCAVNAIAFDPIELVYSIDNIAIASYKNDPPGEILEKFQIGD